MKLILTFRENKIFIMYFFNHSVLPRSVTISVFLRSITEHEGSVDLTEILTTVCTLVKQLQCTV